MMHPAVPHQLHRTQAVDEARTDESINDDAPSVLASNSKLSASLSTENTSDPSLSHATHPSPDTPLMRTIYIGNIPANLSLTMLLDHIHSGALESVRVLHEKNSVFTTFVDTAAAEQFYEEKTSEPLVLMGSELKIGWGKATPMSTQTRMMLNNGATRCVVLGGLPSDTDCDTLYPLLKRFGVIEHVQFIQQDGLAYFHFLSIAQATACISTLLNEPQWRSCQVTFGKDRCSMPMYDYSPPYTPQQAGYATYSSDVFLHPIPKCQPNPYSDANSSNWLNRTANRTLYLGNLRADTTCEEICNVIRGGILSQIKHLVDKHIAFVTFVDPVCAADVYNFAMYYRLCIKNRRLKVGWGKPSRLPAAVVAAVQGGGSRNVYLGNLDDNVTETMLHRDFSEYGEIELINTLKDKKCAFVNFTSIMAAIRAVQGIRSRPEYKHYKINYGKDRCGKPNVRPRGFDLEPTPQDGFPASPLPSSQSTNANLPNMDDADPAISSQ